jgi:hypothetical protein
MPPDAMDCAECEKLKRAFNGLERVYAAARDRLDAVSKSGNAETSSYAHAVLNTIRLDCEVARITLERHQRTHAR